MRNSSYFYLDPKAALKFLLLFGFSGLASSQHHNRLRSLASTAFANGKPRDGALVGFTERVSSGKVVSEDENVGWCKDKKSTCTDWAQSGECENNPDFMLGSCAKSCGACKRPASHELCEDFLAGHQPACKRVYFDLDIGQIPAGRVVIDLFQKIVPRTVENFWELSRRAKCGYKGTRFHRIIPGFMAQGGNTCGTSIYGATFEDENFQLHFDEPYLLGMANAGPNTNGDNFFITVNPAPHLDDKFVVFGVVVAGRKVVDRISELGTKSFAGEVTAEVTIQKTGYFEWSKVKELD